MKQLLCLICLICSLGAFAQSDTIVVPRKLQKTASTLFGAGWANTYDDYLTPQEYTGWDVAFMHEGMRPTHWKHITTQGIWRAHFSDTQNRVGNRTAWGARISYQHTWHYNWTWEHWQLRSGLGVKGDLGGLYINRGGNNPGQAYASAALMASVGADWSFRLWGKRPSVLGVQLDAPFLGMMFSPNYMQSYYDIFGKGNYDRNIVCTWPGNCPTLHARLALDIPVHRHTIRISYAADFIQARPNGLRQHTYTHNIMIGWTRRFAILH